MKYRYILIVLMLTITISQAQTKKQSAGKNKATSSTPTNWGVGIRLGDPLGVSAKKYLANGKALEFNIGQSSYWGYDYRDRFYDDRDFRDYYYLGHRKNSAISIQGHLLFQKDFPNAQGLQWYWGVGPQLRFNTFTYRYRYSERNTWVHVSEKVTDVDFGVDGVIGLEYHIPGAPLSAFADINLLLELADDPFNFFGQGGIGIRYNFN
ncbi:hypothetical protein [Chryseosolibacter indicus]|uniref:Outer membrane protein beta-barrel domain-containing protein n=1 Tax=Chryseosolibacter indicus TaxID=2782351 RepID=A0ABS5VV65_9BACT|nr:hypothetical protein [Chryseosolibacter indicus]MBT1704692.1 hypothetical protein [Chryseosolibacter indicus]